jgi:hypothetical protein
VVEPSEAWLLAGLGVLQLGVAVWWWQGPNLRRTRAWVTGLFALNGLATLLAALGELSGWPSLLPVLVDRWSNVFLVGFGLVALRAGDRMRWPGRLLVIAAGAVTVAFTAARIQGQWTGMPTQWTRTARNITLWPAIVVGGLALVAATRRAHEDGARLWMLLLAGVGIRYSELTAVIAPIADPSAILADTWLKSLTMGLRLLAFAAMFAAAASLLARRRNPDRIADLRFYDLSLILVLSGFLFGFARTLSPNISESTVYFSLALVRPLVFLGVQARLGPTRWGEGSRSAWLRAGAGFFVCGALAGLLAPLFGFQGLGVWPFLGIGGLVGGMLAPRLRLPAFPDQATTAEASQEEASVSDIVAAIETDRVQLPDDWRQRLADACEGYRKLPTDVQEGIEGMARWERILIALDGAPAGGELPPYERTTPGLHLRTQCPYASIGPEISRTNERADRILAQFGLREGEGAPVGEAPLVTSTFGSAEGLDSPRAKSYELTPLGERVAERLREEVGLADLDPAEAGPLVGETFEPTRA